MTNEQYFGEKVKCPNCLSMVRRDFLPRHMKTQKCFWSKDKQTLLLEKNIIDIKALQDRIDVLKLKGYRLRHNINNMGSK